MTPADQPSQPSPAGPHTDDSDESADLELWDYPLPSEAIAKHPRPTRTEAKLLVVGPPRIDATIADLPSLLRPGDLLVANDTSVMAARLFGRRPTGGKVELLVLRVSGASATALAKPAKKLKVGMVLDVAGHPATVEEHLGEGRIQLQFGVDALEVMRASGQIPLPPYLDRAAQPEDLDRYQTVFAGPKGAVAAPTAGLHFTTELIDELKSAGVNWATVTLHVGAGTFRTLRETDIERGTLHQEFYEVPQATADAIEQTKASGGRVIAIGTTSCRTLEAASQSGRLLVGPGSTDLFIQPGYRMKCVDGLLTNFHLPRSSLLMLVASLIGRKTLLETYQAALQRGYRFYSYGDAMLLL